MTRIFLAVALLPFFATVAGAQSVPPASSPAAAPAAVTLTDATVLIESPRAKLTKYDYDTELLRISADIRPGFSTDGSRVSALVNNLWTTRVLAAAARSRGIDRDADFQRRLASETDRMLAAAVVEGIEAEAAREFDAKTGVEQLARERYIANPAKYQIPEQVSVTHILFEVPKRSSDEAKKLAEDARARIVAGADMNALAKEISEDPSAKRNDGHLDFFAADKVDPAFARAAFDLKKVGDLSGPVQSRLGWHVIRLDGRKQGGVRTFDEVKGELMAEARRAFVEERRNARVNELRTDPKPVVNDPAIEAIVIRPDSEAIRKATEAKKP